MTVNETRENRGMDPRPEPECDMIGIFGPTGFVPIGQASAQAGQDMQSDQQDFQQSADKHDLSMQQQQQSLDQGAESHEVSMAQQKKQLAAPTPAPGGPANKAEGIIPEGKFIHPEFGDLAKMSEFVAYDKETDTLILRGNVDVEKARRELGLPVL